MKKVFFNIDIGYAADYCHSNNVVAIAEIKSYFPRGKNVDGTAKGCFEYFETLENLANYIQDWICLAEDENLIIATIYLNSQKTHKKFIGHQIVEIIDKIRKLPGYKKIKTFQELDFR